MKTNVNFAKLIGFLLIIFAIPMTEIISQTQVLGTRWTVVQFDTGSATKMYDVGYLYDIGRKDGSFKIGPPQSKNDIYRVGFVFDLHGAGIVTGSTISGAVLVSTITGSNYNGKVKSLSSGQDMFTSSSLWDAIGSSLTTYFSNIPYGSNQRRDSSDTFKQAVTSAVNGNGLFKLGIMSQSEDQNNTATTADAYLLVSYTPPPGKISARNSFNGGRVSVDNDTNVVSGTLFTWTAGSQHSLGAIDQEYPVSSGNWRSFDGSSNRGWLKKDASHPNGLTISTSRSFTYGVTAGETATLEAQFKNTFTVSGTVTVASGVTLPIDSGTTVSCLAGSKLVINGILRAIGTPTAPIVFTSPGGETWQGIEFSGDGGSTNGSSMHYCTIKYATIPIKATDKPNLCLYEDSLMNSDFHSSPYDAAMAFYNSLPSINSVTIVGQSNSWNGARFAQGSRGSISNSHIYSCGAGNGIVIEGNSAPSIINNTIENNHYHGIVLGSNSTFPLISGNTINDNGVVGGVKTYTGIDFNNAHADVMSNTIYGSNYGIYAENYAFPRSYSTLSDVGGNYITSNLYGLVAYNNSEPDFGYYDGLSTYGACNRIYFNSSWDASASSYSYAWAQGNYWVYSPPNKITSDGTSTIDYDCYLTQEFDCSSSICGPVGRIASTGTAPDTKTELRDARNARIAGDYSTAVSMYSDVASRSLVLTEQAEALRGIYQVFLQTRSADLIRTIASYESGSLAVTATELEMHMNAGIGNYAEVKRIADKLSTSYPNSEIEKNALLQLAWLSGQSSTQQATSATALTELKQKYASSVDQGLLAAIGSNAPAAQQNQTLSQESSQSPMSSYPNPFNPSTQIRYKLDGASKVLLKVYDLLGREVATLVNSELSAGSHSAQFDGSKLASGVYIARLSIAPLEGNNSQASVYTMKLVLEK